MINIFEYWPLKLFDIIDRLGINEITEKEQDTPDKFEINVYVDLNGSSNEKNMEKAVLDI